MLSNSIYGIRMKGDISNFVVGNNIELEEIIIKDQDGHDFVTRKLKKL